MRVALAAPEDLNIVLGLIEEAATWLRFKGLDQWRQPWPDKAARDTRVLKGLEGRKTWIVWHGNIPAATVTMATRANPEVWSPPGCICHLSEPAVYVHRLITARNYAGWGLGAELIDWAGVRAHNEYGARWIRIDVWTTNTALHGYYVKRGFEPCGTCEDETYPSGALFQKPVTSIKARSSPLFAESATECGDTGRYAEVSYLLNPRR
jgi:GNAT superfamily N-acetyltransferase